MPVDYFVPYGLVAVSLIWFVLEQFGIGLIVAAFVVVVGFAAMWVQWSQSR